MPRYLLNSDLFAAFARLGKRLRLKQESDAVPAVSSIVMPITNMDDLIGIIKQVQQTITTTGGGQVQVFVTVPAGKRWKVWAFYMARDGGDRNLNWVYISMGAAGAERVNLDSFTAAATYVSGILAQPITLDQGQALLANVTGGTTDGDYTTYLWITEEDAF